MNLLYKNFIFFKNKKWTNSSYFLPTKQLKLLSKSLLLLLFMVALGPDAWAQPSSIEVLEQSTLDCEGKVKLKFFFGTTDGCDDYLNYGSLYLKDNDAEREILWINGHDADDYDWERRGTAHENTGYIENVQRTIQGDNNYLTITIRNLTNRSVSDLEFRLSMTWNARYYCGVSCCDESSNPDDLKKTLSKFAPINSITTTPIREACNPTEIKIKANASVSCNKSGFKYRVTLQKADNSAFSSPTTLINNKIYDSGSAGSSITTEITDTTAAAVFYRSKIEYIDNAGKVYDTKESVIMPVQEFSVAPPTLTEVSNDKCANTIGLKWEYTSGEADKFNLYRSGTKNVALDFDGVDDRIEIQNSMGICASSELTFEADIKLDLLNNSNIFYLPGAGVDLFTDSEGQFIAILGGVRSETGRALPIGSWVHVTVIYSAINNYIKVYFDGALIHENNTSLSAIGMGTSDLRIGYYNTGAYLEGELDNVRIWHKVLDNIDQNATVTGTESDLKLWLDFSEGIPFGDNQAISTIQDKSSSGYTASLSNFAKTGNTSNFTGTFSNYQKIKDVSGTTLEYEDSENIEPNREYSYQLTVVKTCEGNTNESSFSNSLVGFSPTKPLAPTDLTINVDQANNFIILNWKDNAFDETAYEIHRRYGDATAIFTTEPNDTSFVDANIVACRRYEYDVYAKNICESSTQSVQGSARLEPNLDAALSSMAVDASKGSLMNRVELTWTPQNNTGGIIDRYRIYRKPLGSTDSIQIGVVSGSENLYRDATANAGVLSEYTIIGEVDCDGDILKTNSVSTIGFRTATGLVSGQVTFAGGNAVENAKILVSSSNGTQTGRSLQLDGVDDKVVFDTLDLQNNSFTIEFWAKRQDANAGTLVSHGANLPLANQNLNIGFNSAGNFSFDFGSNELVTTATYNNTDWQHWACVYDATASKRYIYLNGELVKEDIPSAAYIGEGPLQLGVELAMPMANYFAGNLDEFRVWNTAKDSITVNRDFNRILGSGESNLLITSSFDEGIGLAAYDRSRTGAIYNSRHAQIMGTTDINNPWSTLIPTPDQLGLYALTDANGSYVVSAIPYNGNGQLFRVVPQLGTHQFTPSQTNLFIGSSSDIHNNIDFIDISSFPVTGSVFYKGTSCPAEDIAIQIDGKTALLLNGEEVATNSMGFFTVDVPIGMHRISLYKEGHEFAVGNWPTDESLYNFQEPVSGIEFIDDTKLDIVGRVVGGIREGDKVPALGRSVNNLGVARIIFESVAGNGCHTDTVFTDLMTGEYSTQLYPLEYTVEEVRVMNPAQNISTVDFGVLPLIKLIDIGTQKTAKDTVYISGSTTIERVDSAKYHYQQDFIYRKVAEIAVVDEDDPTKPFIGEKTITLKKDTLGVEDTTIQLLDLVTSATNPAYPIFKRAKTYNALIKVHEKYQNFDDGAPISFDEVPVTDGKLIISNTLAADNQQTQTISVNDGDTLYTFLAGRPNVLIDDNNSRFSFTRTMDITLERPGQVEDVKWYPNEGISIDERVFRGVLLGFQTIEGTNFVTNGPEKVDFVLRDPPGTSSTASYTKETAITWGHNVDLEIGVSKSVELTATGGSSIETGIGVSTEISSAYSTTGGFEIEAKASTGYAYETTTTNTIGYTTNENNEAVGARSDVYIGSSTNVNFGLSRNINPISSDVCNLPGVECVDYHPSIPFLKIGKRVGFYVTPSSDMTTFAYTHNHLVNYLIPNIKALRDNLFLNSKYTSHLDNSNTNFGTDNDDPIWGTMRSSLDSITVDSIINNTLQATRTLIRTRKYSRITNQVDHTGPSYTWNGNIEDYGFDTDSVRWYNQQIRLWEAAIAANEKDKVDAINGTNTKDELISFNGEVNVSRGQEVSSSHTFSWGIEFGISKEWKNSLELNVGGTGTSGETSLKAEFSSSYGGERGSESTTNVEYELADGDQGDFMSVQVYKSPGGWGPIFQTISGQTGCPHEDEVKTEYYQPGTVISNRTLQRDKVAVDIFPKVVQNVPEGESAVFNVQFQNTSETNDAREYAVRIDPTSNPDGLSVSMDGETIAVPNDFALPGGSVLTKAITVERGPEKYEYNDIRLLFYVPCQYAAGTADEVDLVDTAIFSVTFLPECTDIRLKEPEDKWVLNTSNKDSLTVTIDNYDINKNGFEAVSLQYKPASESRWTELEKWWHPINKADEEGEKIPTDRSFIRYFWNMASFPDGDYHIRTVSDCELADTETDFMEGHADRINPHPFGTPSPGDGICDPGEDLQIKFNEPIDIGSLTSLNFDIRGVLNGTPLRHEESIAFDGSNDYVEIPDYDLTKRSFAVEFWTKLNSASGTKAIFSQGTSAASDLFVGFSQGKIQFRLAGKTLTADAALPVNEWKHVVVNYDYEAGKASIFVDGVEVKVASTFTTIYAGTGLINVGKNIANGNEFFNGNIHELRLWSKTRSTIDIVPNMNISLSPTTAGLIGYWPMTEGIGTLTNEKVRKRNGVLKGATWTVLPLGQAIRFNGTTDYLEAKDVGTLVLTDEADMTMEVWFKGSSAGTLLSNGLAELGSNENGWLIGLDGSGKIITQNNGNTFASNTGGYLDNDWHHLSVVLERNSAISLYIDGALMNVGESRDWKGFGAAKLWIGCRGGFVGSVEQRDQFFAGDLDDIRIWNTARRPEQIERDRVHRLSGDELGLVAYYPFEAYKIDAGVPVLTQSLRDTSMNAYHLMVGTGANLNYVQATPPIKLPRPIQKVNFTYSVNQDEIILTPTDPSGRLEHVTLDITTRNVKDLYGNSMQSPATWIAFMNKNQVYWDRTTVALEKLVEEEMTFEATILNTGGSAENFQILNIPSWLTASTTAGTISPNSSQNIEFKVSKGVNIGTYEQDILLSTDFGFNERLVLNLKVTATAPDWIFDASLFQHSMSYAGQLSINDVISTDIEDRISVFVGNELRGAANVELDPGTGKYLVFLDVYSNGVSGEALTFKIWNASDGKVHQPVTPTNHTFELHGFKGTPLNPQIFSAIESVQQSYTLKSGWNWISFPLASATLSDVNETLDGLTPMDNDRILSQDYLDVFSDADGWNGTLSLVGNGFNRKEGYKIFLTEPGTFTYNGALGNPADEPIALTTNWNWIGYIGDELIELNTALASLNPSQGDMIKGQRTFAIYENGVGWNGSLDFLEPTKGYMISLSTAGTLVYPNIANFTNPVSVDKIAAGNIAQSRSSLVTKANRLKVITEKAGVKVSAYQKNMPMVVSIAECSALASQDKQLYLAAYKDGQCRGISPIERNGGQELAYLMVHGTATEQLDFRIVNEAHRPIFDIVEKIAFQNDALIGSKTEPKVMNIVADCATSTVIGLTNATPQLPIGEVAVYPNPFKEALNIEFQLAKTEHISVTLQDVTGRIIAHVYDGTLEEGAQKMTWKESSVGLLSEGIYLLTIQSDSMKHIEKVIR